jgi:23S rRNA-/tRNA-specific pseudouridylate synthase
LIEARPRTGRTHQIRVHLLAAGHPVVGDDLYGKKEQIPERLVAPQRSPFPLGLRAVELAYMDPFLRRRIEIRAPAEEFLEAFGMGAIDWRTGADPKQP